MAVDFGADVVAIGPGMNDSVSAGQLLGLLDRFSGGVVIDADGLNVLAGLGRWHARWPHNVVLTPHPGEMRRLLDGWGLEQDVGGRQACAMAYATATGAVVVLKGAGTVVSDGERIYINQTGNAGMATAGAGDVLTGVIAGLMGPGLAAFDAAILGVYVHGLAGDSGAEQLGRVSLMATDLLDYLPDAFCDLEQEPTD
jgi:NAD(P)H-hydrate epimerase